MKTVWSVYTNCQDNCSWSQNPSRSSPEFVFVSRLLNTCVPKHLAVIQEPTREHNSEGRGTGPGTRLTRWCGAAVFGHTSNISWTAATSLHPNRAGITAALPGAGVVTEI